MFLDKKCDYPTMGLNESKNGTFTLTHYSQSYADLRNLQTLIQYETKLVYVFRSKLWLSLNVSESKQKTAHLFKLMDSFQSYAGLIKILVDNHSIRNKAGLCFWIKIEIIPRWVWLN